MRPRDVIDCLASLLPTGQNIFLWGPPGCGKTDITGQVTEQAGMHLLRHPPAATMDAVDVGGLPAVRDGKMVRAYPDFWPTQADADQIGKPIVVFLDELPQGTAQVQAAYMQAIWSRRIGEFKIPDSVVFVAAGNRQQDRAGANRILTPLLNRFLHIDLEVSVEDWLNWAYEAGIHADIRAYHTWKGTEDLHNFDPSRNERAFASPRSWAMLSQVLDQTPAHLLHQVAEGIVGTPAASFCGFRKIRQELPVRADIYKSPRTAAIPKSNPAVLYALALAIAEDSREIKDVEPIAIYGQRLPGEISALCLRETWSANCLCPKCRGLRAPTKMVNSKEGMKWIAQHKDVLQSGEGKTARPSCTCKR